MQVTFAVGTSPDIAQVNTQNRVSLATSQLPNIVNNLGVNVQQQSTSMLGVISVYADRTFSFITKTPPAAVLLLKAAGMPKGSGTPNKEKLGKVTEKQIIAIATQKMPDLNATTVEAAAKSIRGTARSMGIEVVA